MTSGGLGVWLFPGLVDDRTGTRVGVARVVEAITLADDAGIDEVWLGDEGPSGWDPFVVASAALAQTRRVRVAIGIANPVSRHPSVLATASIALDSLAPGRVVLGLGIGGAVPLAPFGLRSATVASVESCVHMVRAVVTGHRSDAYDPPDHPIVAPSLPIYVGARGPRMNTMASSYADGVMLSGIAAEDLNEVIRWAHANNKVRLSILPVSAPGESPDLLRSVVSGLTERFPGEVVGVSLVDADPVAAIERFVRSTR
jgi:alkanesulfonate monooxygenase SsuD/methylene tetrahydromethanopterin reductase-like flavin-dependent oxidoreductase (luciferase family)